MKRSSILILVALVLVLLLTGVVLAEDPPDYDFATPLFGLAAAPDGSLLVADGGAGIIELRKGEGSEVMFLPGVTDVAPIGRGAMFALTGGAEDPDDPTAFRLYRASRGNMSAVANLREFEEDNNPDKGPIDSNPYDVAALNGGTALVADAAGNDLLIVDNEGNVDWVAIFPPELASVDHAQALLGCPNPALPPFLAEVCDIPAGAEIPAEAVSTSVAIGPDGAYYVGELKGFPAPTGMSKVWRVEPGTLNADCATSSACSVVYDDFTSIVDLAFGPDGTLYVVELDENSWLAVELAFFGLPPAAIGGTINACAPDGSGCSVVTGAFLPTAVAVDKKGAAYAAVNGLIPGAAEVIHLP